MPQSDFSFKVDQYAHRANRTGFTRKIGGFTLRLEKDGMTVRSPGGKVTKHSYFGHPTRHDDKPAPPADNDTNRIDNGAYTGAGRIKEEDYTENHEEEGDGRGSERLRHAVGMGQAASDKQPRRQGQEAPQSKAQPPPLLYKIKEEEEEDAAPGNNNDGTILAAGYRHDKRAREVKAAKPTRPVDNFEDTPMGWVPAPAWLVNKEDDVAQEGQASDGRVEVDESQPNKRQKTGRNNQNNIGRQALVSLGQVVPARVTPDIRTVHRKYRNGHSAWYFGIDGKFIFGRHRRPNLSRRFVYREPPQTTNPGERHVYDYKGRYSHTQGARSGRKAEQQQQSLQLGEDGLAHGIKQGSRSPAPAAPEEQFSAEEREIRYLIFNSFQPTATRSTLVDDLLEEYHKENKDNKANKDTE